MKYERKIAIALGMICLVFLFYVFFADREVKTPEAQMAFRFISSIVVAMLATVMPGFLNVDYKLGGLAIRAGSGVALFLLTFFGVDWKQVIPLQEAKLQLEPVQSVEFRALEFESLPNGPDRNSPLAVTYKLDASNTANHVAEAELVKPLGLSLKMRNGVEYGFKPLYFVEIIQGPAAATRAGATLGVLKNFGPITVTSSQSRTEEVLHEQRLSSDTQELTWENTLDLLLADNIDSVKLSLELKTKKKLVYNCLFDKQFTRDEVKEFLIKNGPAGVIPRWFRLNCSEEGASQWVAN